MTEILSVDKVKQNQLDEHDPVSVHTKKVSLYGWNGTTLQKVRINVDSDGNLAVRQAASSIASGNKSIGDTATQLAAVSTPCKRVIVHAADGHVVVGDSSVVYAEATRKGIWIPKGNSMPFYVDDINKLYAVAASGSTVNLSFVYEN